MATAIVGIAGGSGAGKTAVAERLAAALGPGVAIVAHDRYYRDRSHLSPAARARLNFDHPDALDTAALVADIETLRSGRAIDLPNYDYARHARRRETTRMAPGRFILIEGILVLADAALRGLCDVKVFVDTPEAERLERRIERDARSRGRSRESVIAQHARTVQPMHEAFVAPTRRYADVVIADGGENARAAEAIRALAARLLDARSGR